METNQVQPESYMTKVGRRFYYGIKYMLIASAVGFCIGAVGGAIFASHDKNAWLAAGAIGAFICARGGMMAGIRRADRGA